MTMNKSDVISFFDRLAPQWDADMIKNDEIIETILQNAEVLPGRRMLDVACGTGVMIPYYLEKGVHSVTAIDISPEMTKIAQGKFPQANIKILCGDVETAQFAEKFDCIVIYNAFPHFPEPERLIRRLSEFLNPGGTLTVAHGMSRAHIDAHHQGSASRVSIGLMHEDALAALFRKYLTLTTKLSTDRMYQITGKRTE
jgi:demethylmenaquinone methyltransferase/2-methoxy-6-polyprenyl-1,4-benzoquinol methylase